jgi:hypothetical protein
LTQQPVPDVHVRTSRRGKTTSSSGEFVMTVREGEELYFSHVSYKPVRYTVTGQKGTVWQFTLASRTRVLDDFNFRVLDDEDEFRSKVLTTPPAVSSEVRMAKENSQLINDIAPLAPQAPKTLEEQFFESLQPSQGATIFSSKPNSGLIGAIRNAINPKQYKPKSPSQPYDGSRINPFRPRVKPDTLAVDSISTTTSTPAK